MLQLVCCFVNKKLGSGFDLPNKVLLKHPFKKSSPFNSGGLPSAPRLVSQLQMLLGESQLPTSE